LATSIIRASSKRRKLKNRGGERCRVSVVNPEPGLLGGKGERKKAISLSSTEKKEGVEGKGVTGTEGIL